MALKKPAQSATQPADTATHTPAPAAPVEVDETEYIWLRLVGLASYSRPSELSRTLYKGDQFRIAVDDAGDEDDPLSFLGMGRRNVDGDLVKPYFKDVTAEVIRAEKQAAKKASMERQARAEAGEEDTPTPRGQRRTTRTTVRG